MKSEHRHELKTNELAEWLANLPEWTKEHLVAIISVSALIIAIAGVYMWMGYNKNVVHVRERIEFTRLLNQISVAKMQIRQAQEEQRDLSFTLLQPAKALEAFAQNTTNDRMAALALIKEAQALRAELLYGTAEEQYFKEQINKAKAGYAEALEKSRGNPALAAAAEFGLGLCAEELGNFEEARQTYQDIVSNSDYEGTVTVAQAKRRLEIMDDYKEEIAFKPNPNPQPASASQPAINVQPTSPRLPDNIIPPFNFNRPLDFSMITEPNESAGSEE